MRKLKESFNEFLALSTASLEANRIAERRIHCLLAVSFTRLCLRLAFIRRSAFYPCRNERENLSVFK